MHITMVCKHLLICTKAIAKYVKWAIRENSPALFGRPTSMECVVPHDSDAYIVCLLNY